MMQRIHSNRVLGMCAGAALMSMYGANVQAGDVVWQGPVNTPSNYGTNTNWVGNVVPGSGDDAVENNGGIIVVPSGYGNTVADIRTGDANGSSGGFSLTGGSLTVTGHAYFANGTSSTSAVNITSGTLNVSGIDGELDIGGDGAGTFTMSGGLVTAHNFYEGAVTHGSGVGTQTGGTLNITKNFVMDELKPADTSAAQTPSTYALSGGTITVASEMYVGAHGPATFTLSGNGFVSVANTLHLGSSGALDAPAGSGTMVMSGGTLNVTGANAHFVIADHGDGTFNLSGGKVTVDYYNIGQNFDFGGSTRGVVNQSGGSITANLAWVIGEVSRSDNFYDLSGGSITVVGTGTSTNPGDLNVASGVSSRGRLQIRGTGAAYIGNSANVGNAANTSGSLTIADSGILAVGNAGSGTSALEIGISGTGNIQQSGGTVSTDFMTLGQNAGGLGTGTQTGGTLTVRQNLAIGQASTGANTYDISAGTINAAGLYVGATGTASSGNGTLKISGTARVSATANFETAASNTGSVLMSGGSLNAVSFVNRSLYSQSGGSASLGAVTGTGTILSSGGTLTAASITQGTLTLSGSGVVAITPNGSNTGLSVINNLSIATGSKLDLNDNDLVIDYTSPNSPPDVRTYIKNGLITSSKVTSSPNAGEQAKTALGYAEASSLPGVGGGMFDGVAVDNSAVIVKYTYVGDANLDGKVNIADLGALATNYGQSGTNWVRGDFNYDGTVNIADLGLLATDYGAGSTTPLSMSFQQALASVEAQTGVQLPEPSSCAMVAGVMIGLSKRTRRRA